MAQSSNQPLRILVSCLQGPSGYPIPAYDFWRTYFKNGIEEAGHDFLEVEDADWAKGLTLQSEELNIWRAEIWQKSLDFIRREHRARPIHLFLSYLFPAQIDPTAIREIQKLGIPCVNFFCDNRREFRTVPEAFRVFDLHWVPEIEAVQMYRKAGLAHIWRPMPCWVPPDARSPSEETEKATFIGRCDVMRRELFGRAFRSGADFQIRGAGWGLDGEPDRQSLLRSNKSLLTSAINQIEMCKSQGVTSLGYKLLNKLMPLESFEIPSDRLGPSVSGPEYVRLTREAKVSLGVSRVPAPRSFHRFPLRYSRLRDIEAPMLGACYLTEWSPDLGHLYELGEEIEVYHSAEDLAEKLNHLLASPDRRAALRIKGQKRALASHSIGNSLEHICAALGLKA